MNNVSVINGVSGIIFPGMFVHLIPYKQQVSCQALHLKKYKIVNQKTFMKKED